jgi:cytochrome c-type biogenesis protein
MTHVPLSIGLALLAGVLTILSPCVLPVLPIILGRSLQSHRFAPVVLVLGLVSGFAVAGSLLGFASSWIAGFATGLRGVAIAFLLIMGLFALFPQWSYGFARFLPRFNSVPGLWGEFGLGTQLGILWTPCAGSVLGSILVLAAVKQEVVGAFWLLVFYGLGAGVPMLAIAYAGRSVSQSLQKLRPHSQQLQRVGGLVVIGTAIAILQGWDVKVQLWLAPLFPSISL